MGMAGRKKKQRPFTKAPYVSERPHVSERTYMFQKNPICLKRDQYVAHMLCFLKDFLPHMLKNLHMLQTRSPYVAHMQPICGPYVSAAVVFPALLLLLWCAACPRSERSAGGPVMICLCPTIGARPGRAHSAFAFPALLLLLWRAACPRSERSAGGPALIFLYA